MRILRTAIERLEPRKMLHGMEPHISYDVTGDGMVDNQDQALVASLLGTDDPLGDTNFDRLVDQIDANNVSSALGSTVHMDDAVKHAEHIALLKLVSPLEATAVVVQSGNWSDPMTWQDGRAPIAGDKIWVPVAYTLSVDTATPAIRWMRVDGGLEFSSGTNTQLNIDTLIGTERSSLEIAPAAGFSARITFTDGGAIDTMWDRFAISRGLIWHGESHIQGESKTAWTTALPVNAGATSITVADATGWKIGDRLVLGGGTAAQVRGYWTGLVEDDVVVIAGIMGNAVALSSPLRFNHQAVEYQNPVVTNTTRSVVVESAATDISRRGHVMFMHSSAQDVSFAEFNRLGRTNKAVRVTDPDGMGNGLGNVRGRYSVHFHRTGTASQAAHVNGISVSDSPGWGVVNHDSNVVVENSVSYNVLGAHFVTELGNERGSFTNNVAVRAVGSGQDFLTASRISRDEAKSDLGHSGEGFWLEGGGDVPVIGNVSIGMKASGFTFFATATPIAFHGNVSLYNKNSLTIYRNNTLLGNVPEVQQPEAVFSKFTGNLLQGTVLLIYSACMEFRGNTIVAFNNRFTPIGFKHNEFLTSVRLIDNRVTGFDVGMYLPSEGYNVLQGGYYDNLRVNLSVQNTTEFRRLDISGAAFGSMAEWNVYMGIDSGNYTLDPVYPKDAVFALRRVPDWRLLFAMPNRVVAAKSQVRLNGVPLFFEEQGSDFQFGARLTRFPAEIRYEPDGVTLATGASLNARGMYVGGVPLPMGMQYYSEKVRGVAVA